MTLSFCLIPFLKSRQYLVYICLNFWVTRTYAENIQDTFMHFITKTFLTGKLASKMFKKILRNVLNLLLVASLI
jgi:hypothetical protein